MALPTRITTSIAALVVSLGLLQVVPVGTETLALATGGTTFAFGWGDNAEGQLGNGQVPDDSVPVSVGSGANGAGTWKQIVPAPRSGSASCGISGDDQAFCWGYNGNGQVGDGTKTNRYGGPVAVANGANASGTWKAMTVGIDQWTCGIGGDDRAYCWGLNNTYTGPINPGYLGNGTAGTTDDSVPRLVSNGSNTSGTWKAISAGSPATCAIGSNDRLYCWGDGTTGVLGNGSTVASLDDSVPRQVSNGNNTSGTWKSISLGNNLACGIGTDNKAYCWGNWVPGASRTTPTLVANGDNASGTWKAIATGPERICGIGGDDSAYCWGWGPSGDGTPDYNLTPRRVNLSGSPSVTSIAVSTSGTNYFTCAVAGGSAYCWGNNSDGQLGNGLMPTPSNSPVAVTTSGVLSGRSLGAVSAGRNTVAILTGPGTATVTYNANGATSGAPPPAGSGPINGNFTVAANSGSLAKSGYSFAGWNTLANGTGTTYAAGSGSFTLTGATALYAKWEALPPPPPPPAPPGPPYLREAVPGARQVTLTWAKPDWEGTSSVTQYRAYAAPGGLVCTVQNLGATLTSCTATGLSHLTTYEFWVTAVNAVGESVASNRLSATPLGPPGAPRAVTTSVTDGVLTVTWEPPANDGGQPVTTYFVSQRSPGGDWAEIARLSSASPRSIIARGLVHKATYEFRVTAANAAGEGPASESASGSVTLPPMEITVPGRVPPKSFTVFGDLPSNAEIDVPYGSRHICHVATHRDNVLAFLTEGTCPLAIMRSTASVLRTQVGTAQISIDSQAKLPTSVYEMDVIRVTYPSQSSAIALPDDEARQLASWLAPWRYGWNSTGFPRPSWGGPYVFCPSIAFDQYGNVIDVAKAPPGAPRTAASRCSNIEGSARRTVDQPFAQYAERMTPLAARAGSTSYEVAMLPVEVPPLPPRNLDVDVRTYDATATWRAPATSERAPVNGYLAGFRIEGESAWRPLSVTNTTAPVSFTTWSFDSLPLGKNIDFRVASYNAAGRSDWVTTDFTLDFRRPVLADLPEVVPPQTWMPLFEQRGNPEAVVTTSSEQCSVVRNRYLIFTGPGRCDISIGQANQLGAWRLWRSVRVKVEERADRPARVRELDMVEVTFVDGRRTPDGRSRELLDGLTGPDIEALHLYGMVPGKVPRPLVSERWTVVLTALKVNGSRRAYASFSSIATSGLPEGDGNVIRIGVIRKGG